MSSDWISLSLVCVFTLLLTETGLIAPHQRVTIPNDPRTAYPNDTDIVPVWMLGIIAIILPLIVAGIALFAPQWARKDAKPSFHRFALTLFAALVWTNLFTECLKLYAGRERPDYQARVLAGVQVEDGRKSFPSGHSSISFASMGVLSAFLWQRLGLWSDQCQHKCLCVLLGLWPLAIAAFVATSRTRDYHHNFSDILAGCLIGGGFAILACRVFQKRNRRDPVQNDIGGVSLV